MEDEMLLGVAVALCTKAPRKKRLKWTKNWLLERKEHSHVNLLCELRFEPSDWNNYLRMDEETYFELLQMVAPIIKKESTVMRESITPHEQLSATLRFLATGRNYEDLKFSTIISAQALGRIIPRVCKAIFMVLRREYCKFPTSEEQWKRIGKQFEMQWQFPNCLGAVDGKHVRIRPPPNSGSFYFNYKGFHSMVLMAVVNADYEFIMFDFGTNGRISDGGAIENTQFYDRLLQGQLKLPPVDEGNNLPFVFVGDEAFTLRHDFIKPFSERELTPERKIFNTRLSRARRVVENAFGIMASRFRIFHTEIGVAPCNIRNIVLASCALHNFLRRKCCSTYSSDTCDVGETREMFTPLERGHNRNHKDEARNVRNLFLQYFLDHPM